MHIRHIELFVAAAEDRHFSRAAQRMNIVQSGMSTAIQALEEELGALLFIRSTRRVELSPAGRTFLPEARRILEAVQMAKASVAGARQGLTGRLAIGTIQTLPAFLDLPLLLQRFRNEHPQVEIVVRETYLGVLASALRDGSLDLAFMPMSGVSSTGLSVDRLFTSPMVAALAADHRLFEHGSVTLAELSGEPFIDFSPHWGTRHLVDRLFSTEGVVRNTSYEVENYDLVCQFVLRGFGLAVIPEAMAQQRDLPFLRIVPTKGDGMLPSLELGLFRPKGEGSLSPNPPADLFRAMVNEHAWHP